MPIEIRFQGQVSHLFKKIKFYIQYSLDHRVYQALIVCYVASSIFKCIICSFVTCVPQLHSKILRYISREEEIYNLTKYL